MMFFYIWHIAKLYFEEFIQGRADVMTIEIDDKELQEREYAPVQSIVYTGYYPAIFKGQQVVAFCIVPQEQMIDQQMRLPAYGKA